MGHIADIFILPRRDLVPAALQLSRTATVIETVTVLRRSVIGRLFSRINSAQSSSRVFGLAARVGVVPGVVANIQAVGDHQFRQPRGVRVVALGTTELVIHAINRSGVNRSAPVVSVERIVLAEELRWPR